MKIIRQLEWRTIIEVLKKNGLVVFPSDTVYGALVDATDRNAVTKLLQFKNRPPGKAISIFVSDLEMAGFYVKINNKQKKILKELIPGPLTIALPSRHQTDSRLESEKGTLAIRLPLFDPIVSLVSQYKKPLTATSANLGGYPPHYSIDSLLKQLPKKKQEMIDLIVDLGKLPYNKPSTVIDLSEERLKILRHGDLNFINTKTWISASPRQTKKIAQYLLKKNLSFCQAKPLIFIIEGDLGVGKTIFVKGLGEVLGIKKIVSPSFVIFYEYQISHHPLAKKLIHFDLFNIIDEEEFSSLKINSLLNYGNIIAIEWGEKIGKIYYQLKEKGKIIYLKIEPQKNPNERKIIVSEVK